MQDKTASEVKKRLKTRRVLKITIIPNYITVIYSWQDVRFQIKDQKRTRKKPGKTSQEVNAAGHLGDNMVDVISPSQCVINYHTQELEGSNLLNF